MGILAFYSYFCVDSFAIKFLLFDVIDVGDVVGGEVEVLGFVLNDFAGVEEVAADERGVIIVGVAAPVLEGTVERSMDFPLLNFLVYVDGPFGGTPICPGPHKVVRARCAIHAIIMINLINKQSDQSSSRLG